VISKFDPKSARAIKGLSFQNDVQDKLSSKFNSVINSRDWLLSIDPFLKIVQLNTLEHTWGDVVLFDERIQHPIFIECVSINHEKSIFPEHKVKKFEGLNKYYCFGWDDEKRFVHSKVWNSYARKLKLVMNNNYRSFTKNNITGLRSQFICVDNFCEAIFKVKSMQYENKRYII